MIGLREEELKFINLLWSGSGRKSITSIGLDVDFKSIYTVHRNTSIFTCPALTSAGCYRPPWLTNQNCTTAVCPQKTGDLLSHDSHGFHLGNTAP